ncbi:MAG: acyl-CoA thioesterase II [Pseudomonadota bacterium]
MSDPNLDPVDQLIELLSLERLEVDLFRGVSPDERSQRVFGGQVIGQALMAAYQTVEDRVCHSLHAYFIRPGDPNIPIIYEVDRSRDGRSFTTRRVIAIQHGKQIFNLAASFQVPEDGFEHQMDMPEVAGPEGLKTRSALRLEAAEHFSEETIAHFKKKRAVEMRPVNPQPLINPEPMSPDNQIWFRTTKQIDVSPAIHQCILAYASDMSLLDSGTRPHGLTWHEGKAVMASLDHAMWFHADVRTDDWLLYSQDSPSASGARSFNRGSIYTREGKLVASVAQEGLMRPKTR